MICLYCRRPGFNPWVRKIPRRREWLPTAVFLPGESHGQKSLVGYSPWGHKELDMADWLIISFSFHQRVGVWRICSSSLSDVPTAINIAPSPKTEKSLPPCCALVLTYSLHWDLAQRKIYHEDHCEGEMSESLMLTASSKLLGGSLTCVTISCTSVNF